MTGNLVEAHYGRKGLSEAVQEAFESDEVAHATPDALAAFGGLHSRARQATNELADLADLQCGARVLDIGSGLGGPARHLAAAYGVHVTGLELTADYVRVARLLTERAAIGDRVVFEQGNAISAPFPSGSFHCVWVQHMLMNVANKVRLFREIRRVLGPGGTLAVHEIVAPDAHHVGYPLPWARTPLTSFVPRPERLRTAIESAGFALRVWKDTTQAATDWYCALAAGGPNDPTAVGLRLLLGPDAPVMIGNLARNLEAGRLGAMMAVFTRTP